MSMVFVYPPNDQYVTTPLSTTFPETRWPMQDTFHKVGHAVHGFVHPHDSADLRTPNADIRETVKNYYIDVELPGVGSKDELSLTWTSARTLLVEATVKRPEIPEERQPLEKTEGEEEGKDGVKSGKAHHEHPVHFLARERRFGQYGRAFHLPFNVDHDKVETTMKSGLLRLVVPKPEIEHKAPKKVEVKHEDD